MPKYEFKIVHEIVWAAVIGTAIAAATIAVDFEPETIQDWERWAITGVGALARAVGVAILTVLRPR